jgi:hypothetical protein
MLARRLMLLPVDLEFLRARQRSWCRARSQPWGFALWTEKLEQMKAPKHWLLQEQRGCLQGCPLTHLLVRTLASKFAPWKRARELTRAPSWIPWRVAAEFLLAPSQQPCQVQSLVRRSVRQWQKLDGKLAWTWKLWRVL